jgi:hypothetical protein
MTFCRRNEYPIGCLDDLKVGRRAYDFIILPTVDGLSVDQWSVGQMVFDQMTWSGLNIFEGLRKKFLMAETFFIFYANAKRRDRQTDR